MEGSVADFAAANVDESALTESSVAGSTTNAPMVTVAIATAISPKAVRGVEGSYPFMLCPLTVDLRSLPECEDARRSIAV